jgi:hypothetical protein
MKTLLTKNWPAKIASFLAAFAIWYMIHQHISEGVGFRFITERARNQQLLQENLQRELQQKLVEVSILQQKIDKAMIENAPRANPVIEPEKQSPTPPPSSSKSP